MNIIQFMTAVSALNHIFNSAVNEPADGGTVLSMRMPC